MSKKKNDFINIQKYRKKENFNIGIVVFGIILIYLLITIIIYMTDKHVSVYEVREGSLLRDNAYTGIILREESLITTDADGYVAYYSNEGSKIGVGTNVYTLSENKDSTTLDTTSNEESVSSISKDDEKLLVNKTQKFNENFKDQDFVDTYTLKTEIDSILQSTKNQNRVNQLDNLIASGQSNDLSIYPAQKDGIVIYNKDGFESITKEEITKESFDRTNYNRVDLVPNRKLASGDPVYKLITSEDWSLIVPITKETANELADKTVVKIKITKDNELLWANLDIFSTKEGYYGCLSFDNSMIRYATERFLDVELILEDESGLKIPKSAKTTKSFFVVPQEYITKSGVNKETGVYIKSSKKKNGDVANFIATQVFYKDKDGLCYLNSNELEAGDTVLKPESDDTLTLSQKKKLPGVYNINKGYAVFKQITILCESEEYYIVKEGDSYGLSNYDHIVLDGKTVNENDVVFQ
ncbi:HlyD family efflux transporter periplasmic adaptor subunit [Lachnospiraceae bacterium LCP25S3_G4]